MGKLELQNSYFFDFIDDFILPELFKNTNYPWEVFASIKNIVERLTLDKKSSINGKISDKSTISGWVLIGENTVVEENVKIEGPVIIGDNCTIKHGALIRPWTIISDNCVVGHGSEVKNSLMFNGAKISSLVFVGDSILGKGSRVGSGTITANRRFDQKNIGIKIEESYYGFGTDFFGCIIGDYSRIGANCTTLPGTFIGPYTWIMPLTRVEKFIPREKIIGCEQVLIQKDNASLKLKD